LLKATQTSAGGNLVSYPASSLPWRPIRFGNITVVIPNESSFRERKRQKLDWNIIKRVWGKKVEDWGGS
jgi:hypothetical protein